MENNWANNSHLTRKARLFAAAAAADISLDRVCCGSEINISVSVTRAPTTAAAASFVVVLPRPQIIIPSSPSIASLEIQARRRNRKCRHGSSIAFHCDESPSSSVLLNYSGRNLDDDDDSNNCFRGSTAHTSYLTTYWVDRRSCI
jgi:hypothetical protein